METKERRKTIRIPLINEMCKWKLMDGIDFHESKLVDFTQYGAYIHSAKPMPVKSYLNVYFQLPGDLGAIKVDAQIKWQRWAVRKKDAAKKELGFGIEFIDVTPNLQKILDSYSTYLRNKQIITVSKKIIEEFFGERTPPVK